MPGRPDSRNPADPRTRAAQPPAADGEGESDEGDDLAKLAPVLRHGGKIDTLSSEQQGRFNELMMAGEQQLKEGDYMLAEQRFQRALRFSPGHPLAIAGAANAQIGAGLYLPAAYTLRMMYTQNPEMIDATFDQELLPTPDRMTAAVDGIKSRLEGGQDRAGLALVLAYIGRQSSDRSMIEEGVRIMGEVSAEDPLASLLRMVWLEGAAAPKSEEDKPADAPAIDPEK